MVSVTTGSIPARPSSGIRAGAEIWMLTVGTVFAAPVIGSIPGSFETTTSAAAAISDGVAARTSPVAARFRARYSRASRSASAT